MWGRSVREGKGREGAQSAWESITPETVVTRHLRRIPVVVLTTSKAEEDIIRSYNLGVSGFITKPVTFKGLVEAIKALGRYWFEIVELPS